MAHDSMDDKLDAPNQRAISQLVSNLPQDVPNLAWRAVLSDRIANEAKRSYRSRWLLHVGRPLAGLAVTASLAGVVLLRGIGPAPERTVASRSIEATLVRAHRESEAAFDVSGTELGNDSFEGVPASFEGWDESDVEAL